MTSDRIKEIQETTLKLGYNEEAAEMYSDLIAEGIIND